MQELEKILEEIDETIERYGTNPYIDVKVTDLCYGLNIAKDIIRRHMNDGWIPVEERLPERNGEYIVTACDEGEPYDEIIWNDTVVVCAEYYKGCWTWEENRTEYSLDGIVTHWMPLPEPPEEV